MIRGYRIWPDRISTSYGTQPNIVIRFSKLVRITMEAIGKICTKGRRFYVPDRIMTSVEGCLANDDDNALIVEYLRLR